MQRLKQRKKPAFREVLGERGVSVDRDCFSVCIFFCISGSYLSTASMEYSFYSFKQNPLFRFRAEKEYLVWL